MDSLDRRLILGAFVVVALAFGYGSCRQRRANARAAVGATAQAQADQHRDAATSHAAQGAIYDQQAEAQKPALEQDAAEVAHHRAEVARLRRSAPAGPAAPAVSAPEPVGPAVDLAPLVAEQDRLVAALTKENADLKTQVGTLALARDAWRAAAGDSAAEAVQLRAVIAAKEGLAEAAYWRGFRHGFLAGGVSGVAADETVRWRLH